MANDLDLLDIFDQFLFQSKQGVTAECFWSKLSPQVRTVGLLVDLLLIAPELNPHGLVTGMSAVEKWGGDVEYLKALGHGAFERWTVDNQQFEISDFSSLSDQQRRWLKLSDEPFHLGQMLNDRFIVEQRIGAGNFGVVYRARDVNTGKNLACKTPKLVEGERRDLCIELLANEAITMEKLEGEGCPNDYRMLLHDGHPFLLMQFIDGPSLRDRLRESILDPQSAVRILLSVTKTIENAHEHRVVHRDLKPENILLDNEGNVFVVDFGLVLFENDDQLNREGEIAGTRPYMPPDALLGATHELDGRVDIYAIGIILFESITGELPSRTTGREEALVAAIGAAAVGLHWPDGVPDVLKTIAQRCIESNPLHRYSNAGDLAAELEAFLGNRSVTSRQRADMFLWDAGLLLGKFNHLHQFASTCLDRARQKAPEDHWLQMALAVYFGAQEAALDLRKLGQSFEFQAFASEESFSVSCDAFPDNAVGELRSAFYLQRNEIAPEDIESKVSQLVDWIDSSFDAVHGLSKSMGTPSLALFEFAVLAAQVEGRFPFESAGIRSLASRTGIPSEIWARFVEYAEDPSVGDLPLELVRLKRDVRRFLQGLAPADEGEPG